MFYSSSPDPNQEELELLMLPLPLLRADHVPAKLSQDRQFFFIEPAHEQPSVWQVHCSSVCSASALV